MSCGTRLGRVVEVRRSYHHCVLGSRGGRPALQPYTSQWEVTRVHLTQLLIADVVALGVQLGLAARGLSPLLVLLHQGRII